MFHRLFYFLTLFFFFLRSRFSDLRKRKKQVIIEFAIYGNVYVCGLVGSGCRAIYWSRRCDRTNASAHDLSLCREHRAVLLVHERRKTCRTCARDSPKFFLNGEFLSRVSKRSSSGLPGNRRKFQHLRENLIKKLSFKKQVCPKKFYYLNPPVCVWRSRWNLLVGIVLARKKQVQYLRGLSRGDIGGNWSFEI